MFNLQVDLERAREVPKDEASDYVKKMSSQVYKGKNYFEGSAKTKVNVCEAFEYLIEEIYKSKETVQEEKKKLRKREKLLKLCTLI